MFPVVADITETTPAYLHETFSFGDHSPEQYIQKLIDNLIALVQAKKSIEEWVVWKTIGLLLSVNIFLY